MIKPVQWKTRLELLSQEDIRAIHAASLRIMERTGLVMPLSKAREEQARDLGLKVDTETQRIYFPPGVVEAALKKAPGRYALCARNPKNDFMLDGQHGYLTLDGSGTDVLDLETGEVCASTKANLEAAVRVADALPQISLLWPAVSARDCPARVQPLHELEAMLTPSSKHVQAMTAVDALNARGTVEIAAEVVGGREALRRRPIISNFQCSVSPLSYDAHALEAACVFGEAGVPTGFLNMTIGSGTAPATVAGNAAVANAEVLAGITLFELFFPGVPTFYGSCATTMELRSGGVTAGGPEDFLLQAAGCQMARFYSLPSNIGTFATGAKVNDWHAGVENALSGAVSQFAGADMSTTYAVLGGGRQGTAAAYDMARFGDAKQVRVGDISLEAAQKSAARVNQLTGKEIAQAHQVDVTHHDQLKAFLENVDSFLSAVPYWFNPGITRVAIEAKACMTDLGGNTDLVREQMKLSPQAKEAGIAIIPDCGQVPGMGTSLTVYAMSLLDETEEVMLWDGGNALHPRPPFNYILTFNIAGLTNEYYGVANFIRNGKLEQVPTFKDEDYETVEFPEPIGKMEAFVAGGGTSTMPWTFEGKLKTLWNKTLRWPGHFAEWKAYMEAGLLETEPVKVQGVKVSPREVLHTLLDPKLRAKPGEPDLVIVRVLAKGKKDGHKAQVLLDLIDRFDQVTGFTAMERTTGWDGSIKAIMNAHGVTPRGVNPAELAVPGPQYAAELRKRGFGLTETFTVVREN